MKNNRILFGAIAVASLIFVGSNFDRFIGSSYAHQNKDPNHHTTTDSHGHNKVEIPQGEPIPTISLMVHPDPMKGYNLHIETTNFKFAPENIGKTSSFKEGHGHLYVDGKKITRVYSNWFYLSDLEAGERKIAVTLNSNAHEDLTIKSERIEAVMTVNVPNKPQE